MPEEAEGAAYETLFLQEIMAINDSLEFDYKLFYWRTASGMEVDIVLYGEKGILAFEIKRSAKIRKDYLKGLKAFLADYPMAKAYLIYGGAKRMREGKIEIIPFKDCLINLPAIL